MHTWPIHGCTYPLSLPRLDIKEDIVAPLRAIAQALRYHHVVLGKPCLQLFMIAPIPTVTSNSRQQLISDSNTANLQFCCRHNLLNISWIAVEHKNQSLVVEVRQLALKSSNIAHCIALRQGETRD